MIDLSGLFLSGMLTYGIWALGLATLVSAIGVPLPATMILLAAGGWVWLLRRQIERKRAVIAPTLGSAIVNPAVEELVREVGEQLAKDAAPRADGAERGVADIRVVAGAVQDEDLPPGFQFSLPRPLGEIVKIKTGAEPLTITIGFDDGSSLSPIASLEPERPLPSVP